MFFLFLMQMYAGEILVPNLDEIEGNSRKSEANVQAQTTCSIPFSLSAYLWLRYGMKWLYRQ
ncbi:hypothetical protein POREN0001_0309 [Porphyromonas endodontalis ATCC 35406]|uniref:Uncharacterized protein n=1 Tax=Porphyromonas endodontalis (strain ATCC 35406 / DSM 24491 / JCM 8526 / CCUG 16442 / BCRC 14492 / NCTC 13058 / HG 370) TaxID=553175 RepID=C3JAS1_POREA|nr:hypothetical protein POREN0001_0309 [Porphyromonas endodontalis ATCC 35406]